VSSDYGLGFVGGSRAGEISPLGSNVLVGRDPVAEVRLAPDEMDVSARHAQLYAHDNLFHVVDLQSQGGTYLNGELLEPNVPAFLPPFSVLRFGTRGPLAVFGTIQELDAIEPSLSLERDDGPATCWPLGHDPITVGRGSACDLQLDPTRDALASSQHLHLLPAYGGVIATDLGSANGTWSAGQRLRQRMLRPGMRVHLGGLEGPCLRVVDNSTMETSGGLDSDSLDMGRLRTGTFEAHTPPASAAPATPALEFPETLCLHVQCGDHAARLILVAKTEVHFGSFFGINDLALRCFPRELEDDRDALERSEPLGEHHGTMVLTADGVDLIDSGTAPTKLDQGPLPPHARVPLGDVFELELGEDTLGFRGRVFRHPGRPPCAPALGLENNHPVECVVLERKGDGGDHLYVMLVGQATLGTQDEAAIRLPVVPGAGAMHALIFLREGKLWISQLSQAPVAVDGTPLSPGTALPLQVGTQFYLGAALFRVAEATAEDFETE
jgi:pSer/pThr/pTyr-binding forkhead associated (FHA) protein